MGIKLDVIRAYDSILRPPVGSYGVWNFLMNDVYLKIITLFICALQTFLIEMFSSIMIQFIIHIIIPNISIIFDMEAEHASTWRAEAEQYNIE